MFRISKKNYHPTFNVKHDIITVACICFEYSIYQPAPRTAQLLTLKKKPSNDTCHILRYQSVETNYIETAKRLERY